MTDILVVEDERAVRDSIRRALELEGYTIATADDGPQAMVAVNGRAYDAMVLDIMLPGLNGIEVCRRLRAERNLVPILMLTARDEVGDRVAGLDAGADDYLVKPFALDELRARLRAIMRRGGDGAAGEKAELLRFADLRLDTAAHQAWRGTRLLSLTRTEYLVLELFLRHPRQVLSRSAIFEQVWGYDFGTSSNALGVYIGYLRRKLEQDGDSRILQTVRGVGYVLRDQGA